MDIKKNSPFIYSAVVKVVVHLLVNCNTSRTYVKGFLNPTVVGVHKSNLCKLVGAVSSWVLTQVRLVLGLVLGLVPNCVEVC